MTLTEQEYYSNGKLLITSEYLVLKGATALAVPVQFGQRLTVSANDSDHCDFSTLVINEEWLKCKYDLNDFSNIFSSDSSRSEFIDLLMNKAYLLNPNIFDKLKGFDLVSSLNFNINWGLGSSSSLISNIAYLFDINPFDLHNLVSQGSGYDIACARTGKPILYKTINKIPEFRTVEFSPDYSDNLFFMYTGQKMNTDSSVKKFLSSELDFESQSNLITEITFEILNSRSLDDFNYFVNEHEKLMSIVLKIKTVKNNYFSSFDGEIKSLGAWGGDFVMLSTQMDINALNKYFKDYNLDVIIPFKDMVL